MPLKATSYSPDTQLFMHLAVTHISIFERCKFYKIWTWTKWSNLKLPSEDSLCNWQVILERKNGTKECWFWKICSVVKTTYYSSWRKTHVWFQTPCLASHNVAPGVSRSSSGFLGHLHYMHLHVHTETHNWNKIIH